MALVFLICRRRQASTLFDASSPPFVSYPSTRTILSGWTIAPLEESSSAAHPKTYFDFASFVGITPSFKGQYWTILRPIRVVQAAHICSEYLLQRPSKVDYSMETLWWRRNAGHHHGESIIVFLVQLRTVYHGQTMLIYPELQFTPSLFR